MTIGGGEGGRGERTGVCLGDIGNRMGWDRIEGQAKPCCSRLAAGNGDGFLTGWKDTRHIRSGTSPLY